MVLQEAGRKVWRLAQRFVGPVLRARVLPLVIVAIFALVRIMRHVHHTNLTHFLSSPLIIRRYPPISPFLQRWTPLPPLTTGATCHRFRFAPPRSPARLDVLQSISFFATERFALARDAADGIQPRHGHSRRSP
jgi:hypothetical protein